MGIWSSQNDWKKLSKGFFLLQVILKAQKEMEMKKNCRQQK